jgi:hypothetical protein
MDRLRDFLTEAKQHGWAAGHFLGLLNLLIGRHIAAADGTVLLAGVTWRALAAQLKQVRWNKEAVRDLGIDPAQLPPRDRLRYWYTAIAQARVDSDEATRAGDKLAQILGKHGYVIGPAPKSG